MARNILCKECDAKYQISANTYDELYESIPGKAKKDMYCDGAHGELMKILKGDVCFAACLLTSIDHPNYKRQRPEVWADEFIIIPHGNDQSAADDHLDYLESQW